MSDHQVLDAVLDNTQVPHQPFVVIADSAVFSGLPIFRESLRRALNRGGPVLLVTALHSPNSLISLNFGYDVTIVDLTAVVGYETDVYDVEEKILTAYRTAPPGTQVYIDSIDLIAEDHSSLVALKVIRSLLREIKAAKAPSRLTILLPRTSPLLNSLIPPTLSSTITLLHTYSRSTLTYLSQSYLQPISATPHFWLVLERARDRGIIEQRGYAGLEPIGDWSDTGAVISVLVRKATGGIKGISRGLAAISSSRSATGGAGAAVAGGGAEGMTVQPVSALIPIQPITGPGPTSHLADAPPSTHIDLDLPFNLTLTDEQKRRRGEVPLPYAHEGEGVGIELEEEEDEDDEEI